MLDLACVASASAIGLPISGSQLRDGFCVRVSNSKASDCDLQITLWKVSEPRLRKKREGGSWLWPESAHCEQWFDPETGGVALIADLMVAEGSLIRRWSEEKQQFAYSATDIRPVSQLAV